MKPTVDAALHSSELGKQSSYDPNYNPEKLFPIARQIKRVELGIDENQLPFYGYDCWNHYEVSWLNEKGKPIVALAEIYYDCASPNIIESKSMKLYFHSLNNTKYDSIDTVKNIITNDLQKNIGSTVIVNLREVSQSNHDSKLDSFEGFCIDDQDEFEFSIYETHPEFLMTDDEEVDEVLYSHLLKSNCPITNQPDWGSVQIAYRGKKINHQGLLKYIVSFRSHNEFHEHCIERIYMDIMRRCKPEVLTINARYTRRGGLDINPFRTSKKDFILENKKLVRQ